MAPTAATLAYTEFLLACAATGSVGTICAAMTPCMRLYAYLGQSLTRHLVPGNPYADWIRTYAADDFESLARQLESLLGHHGTGTPVERAAYRRALALEVGFFDAAMNLKDSPSSCSSDDLGTSAR